MIRTPCLLIPFAALLAALLASLVQGCAGITPQPHGRDAACERFFRQSDRLVARQGVADAGSARIEGFPYLRVDRFLASFASPDLTGPAFAAWVERLRRLDESARLLELANLPPGAVSQRLAPAGLTLQKAVQTCGRLLSERDLHSSARSRQLLRRAVVPDSYSTWQRALGLYPVTRWAIAEGISQLYGELRQSFDERRAGVSAGPRLRYGPPAAAMLSTAEVAAMLKAAQANPLGIPEPPEEQLQRMFATFAPIWAIDTGSDSDRIGTVRIDRDGKAYVDVTQPAVYRLTSFTRFKHQALLQLNYIIWLPARPPQRALDIYAGRFDGLIWRVTLAMNGKPLAYDSIHSCGCYYQLFPGEGMRVVQPVDGSEPILSPLPIPRLNHGERLVIGLSSRRHFINQVTREAPPPTTTAYDWQAYDQLRSLPAPDGRHHSLFATNGLIPESARLERFLFWPMGISSAGAMRQWGTHAIAFLGRRHFDDPQLLAPFLRPLRE